MLRCRYGSLCRALLYLIRKKAMNPILNTAFKAARRAGQMMIRASGNLEAVKIDSKAFNDFVSNVDRESEMILVDAQRSLSPSQNHL